MSKFVGNLKLPMSRTHTQIQWVFSYNTHLTHLTVYKNCKFPKKKMEGCLETSFRFRKREKSAVTRLMSHTNQILRLANEQLRCDWHHRYRCCEKVSILKNFNGKILFGLISATNWAKWTKAIWSKVPKMLRIFGVFSRTETANKPIEAT